MKRIVATIAVSLFLCSFANARDSLWGLGDNGKIAISFYEHRSGSSRAIDVTLIVGGWFLAGTVKEPSDGNVEGEATSLTAKDATFEGTISVQFGDEASDVKLKGKLTLKSNTIMLDESIRCKTMAGL